MSSELVLKNHPIKSLYVQTRARKFYDLKSFECHFGTFCRNVGPKDSLC